MLRVSILTALLLCTVGATHMPDNAADKTISIVVNEKSEVTIDRVVFDIELLPKELQQRLWRSFVSTGKMPSAIQLKFTGQVPSATQSLALDGIKVAQEKTLNVLCLHKYKRKFDAISSKRRDKIRKQFAVLFQKVSGVHLVLGVGFWVLGAAFRKMRLENNDR